MVSVNNSFIRKIDELGRVVIPKEVRNKLNIQDNESIIINLDDNSINISKYTYLDKNNAYLDGLCSLLLDLYNIEVEIENRDNVVFSNKSCESSLIYEDNLIKDSLLIGKIRFYGVDTDLVIVKFFIKVLYLYLSLC